MLPIVYFFFFVNVPTYVLSSISFVPANKWSFATIMITSSAQLHLYSSLRWYLTGTHVYRCLRLVYFRWSQLFSLILNCTDTSLYWCKLANCSVRFNNLLVCRLKPHALYYILTLFSFLSVQSAGEDHRGRLQGTEPAVLLHRWTGWGQGLDHSGKKQFCG